MSSETLEALKKELNEWRTKIGELRVKADLAKMEARDKVDAFEEAYQSAKERLSDLRTRGGDRWAAVSGSIEAGWDELRKSYRDILAKRRGPKMHGDAYHHSDE